MPQTYVCLVHTVSINQTGAMLPQKLYVPLTYVSPVYTVSVPDTRVGRCLGPEGNRASSSEGGEGGLGPPDEEGDKLFFSFIFLGVYVYMYVPLPPLRGQHTVLYHPRWLSTLGLTEFAVCWGGAGFEPRTTDMQSGALPLSHLSSLIEPPLISSQLPAWKEATWRRKKKEGQ